MFFCFTSFFTSFADKRPQRITVHRSNVRRDVIEIFRDQSILSYTLDLVVIDVRGEDEAGQGKGVLLDILTSFWQDCFTALTTGSNEKTPYIRHDLQKPEWEAIARVLVYGYQNLKYFSLQLSY